MLMAITHLNDATYVPNSQRNRKIWKSFIYHFAFWPSVHQAALFLSHYLTESKQMNRGHYRDEVRLQLQKAAKPGRPKAQNRILTIILNPLPFYHQAKKIWSLIALILYYISFLHLGCDIWFLLLFWDTSNLGRKGKRCRIKI